MSSGKLAHDEGVSPTAASVGKPLYKASGVITYRVSMVTPTGSFAFVDVDAPTGDEAASAALSQMPGGKVSHVEPAPQKAKAA